MSLAESFGRQLREPHGWAGRLTGTLMRLANQECNGLAVDALRMRSGDTLLEVGCGPGHALALLAARAPEAQIYGIDRSELMLAQACARNRAAVRAGRVRLQRGDCERLPIRASCVDAVLAVNVAYFWANGAQALREIRRVLRRDGQLVIYVTNRVSMESWPFAGPRTHMHWDGATLGVALRAAGFGPGAIETLDLRLRGGVRGTLAIAWMD